MNGKKTILVTGSGGFIFSNFIRYVLKESSSYRIVSIDKVANGSVLNTIYSNKSHNFYIGNITDRHLVDIIFEVEKPDIVVNGAAESFVDASIDNADDFIKSNILGTQVLIDASLKWGIEKFIQISTDEVMGQLKNENDPPWDETAPYNPRNPYSASKASAELMVLAAHKTHGLQYNITRSCNNYGPRQPRRNLIPVIIGNLLDGIEVPIYGQGLQIRDWIHVQDNCAAILKIIESSSLNEIYNISAKQEFTNIEVFHEICKELDVSHDLLKFVEDRKGHDFRYAITNDKIKALGWEPKFNFKKGGLSSTVKWYQNNRWFISKPK